MRNEKRKTESAGRQKRPVDPVCRFLFFAFCFSLIFVLASCASDKRPTTQPSTVQERQEAALKDPFGYSPNMDREPSDVSGGDLGTLDRKAMKRDIDHVLNP